jgi:hypothetical protein
MAWRMRASPADYEREVAPVVDDGLAPVLFDAPRRPAPAGEGNRCTFHNPHGCHWRLQSFGAVGAAQGGALSIPAASLNTGVMDNTGYSPAGKAAEAGRRV